MIFFKLLVFKDRFLNLSIINNILYSIIPENVMKATYLPRKWFTHIHTQKLANLRRYLKNIWNLSKICPIILKNQLHFFMKNFKHNKVEKIKWTHNCYPFSTTHLSPLKKMYTIGEFEPSFNHHINPAINYQCIAKG